MREGGPIRVALFFVSFVKIAGIVYIRITIGTSRLWLPKKR